MIKGLVNFIKNISSRCQGSAGIEDIDEYNPTTLQVWRFYLRYLRVDYKIFLITNMKILFGSIIQSRSIFIILDIKNGLVNANYNDIILLITEYTLSKLFLRVLDMLESAFNQNAYQDVYQSVQKQILEHLLSLDIQYFDNNRVTSLSQIISDGSFQIAMDILNIQFVNDLSVYIKHFGQLYFIYTQSAIILLAMLILSLFSSLILEFYEKKKQIYEKEQSHLNEFKTFALNDILNNILLIKSFCTESKEIKQMNNIVQENTIFLHNKIYYSSIISLIQNSTTQLLSLIPVLYILFMHLNVSHQNRDIAIGLLEIIVHSYSSFFLINNIIKITTQKSKNSYQEERKVVGRVMLLFKQKPFETLYSCEREKDQNILLKGQIEFKNVYFKYPLTKDIITQKQIKQSLNQIDQTKASQKFKLQNDENMNLIKEINYTNLDNLERDYVLKDISFIIKKGSFVSFVGASGSGKSTIVKLIQRFYQSNQGEIIIDNLNIKDINQQLIRRSIGVVSQEPSLFDNDIEYNITYGCPNYQYSLEYLKEICEVSGVNEFVLDKGRFPLGLKTLVGTKGIKLSGGQKQRIAIARALMKKPSILILDEATSSLDAENEFLVQSYIDQLVEKKGMTIIVVAHRLSTIVKSDIIFVVDKGYIKESGSHSHLLEQNGIYKKLILNQMHFSKLKESDNITTFH